MASEFKRVCKAFAFAAASGVGFSAVLAFAGTAPHSLVNYDVQRHTILDKTVYSENIGDITTDKGEYRTGLLSLEYDEAGLVGSGAAANLEVGKTYCILTRDVTNNVLGKALQSIFGQNSTRPTVEIYKYRAGSSLKPCILDHGLFVAPKF